MSVDQTDPEIWLRPIKSVRWRYLISSTEAFDSRELLKCWFFRRISLFSNFAALSQADSNFVNDIFARFNFEFGASNYSRGAFSLLCVTFWYKNWWKNYTEKTEAYFWSVHIKFLLCIIFHAKVFFSNNFACNIILY